MNTQFIPGSLLTRHMTQSDGHKILARAQAYSKIKQIELDSKRDKKVS